MKWQQLPVRNLKQYRKVLQEAYKLAEVPIKRGIEIGLGWGVSAYTFLESHESASLLTIDIQEDLEAKDILKSMFTKRFSFLNRPKGIEESLYSDNVQWLYIDGGHEYDEVKRDIEDFEACLQSGGVIMFDDYDNKNPMYQYPGVKQAVDEFMARHPGKYSELVKWGTETGPVAAVKL